MKSGIVILLYSTVQFLYNIMFGIHLNHTGKCIRRFGGIYAYCRYFINWKW